MTSQLTRFASALSFLVAALASAQMIDAPTARLQVIHASPEPRIPRLNVFVQDGFPAQALQPPLGKVSYGRSSGYLAVPSGKHKLIVCKDSGGSCTDGMYELELNAFGTVVVIGTRGPGGTDDESTVQLVQVPSVASVDLETQRSWKSVTKRRVSLLNGVLDSSPMELCVAPEGKAPTSPFTQKASNLKGEPFATFGEWAGIGQVADEESGLTFGTHLDIPQGKVRLQLRGQGDAVCLGALWGESRLEKPEAGMILLVAVGEGERQTLPRELISCSEPKPPTPSECFRHKVRAGAE